MLSRAEIKRFIETQLCPRITCAQFVQRGANNNYSALNPYKDARGIYLFFGPEHEALYVGSSGHGAKQRLKKRVTQHLTANDEGGTFRDNLAHACGLNAVDAAEWILKYTYVRLAITPEKDIRFLERLAINVFRPKYCSNLFSS